MTLISRNARNFRPRGTDNQLMFLVRYADGRSAFVRVNPKAADHGELAIKGIARARQATGEIPEGEIVSVQRVK